MAGFAEAVIARGTEKNPGATRVVDLINMAAEDAKA